MNSQVIELETVVIAREDLIASNLSNQEMVMMDIDRGFYYGLEDVAKVIWEQLSQARRVSDICASITGEFEVDAATVEKDTMEFLNELHRENLIVINPPSYAS